MGWRVCFCGSNGHCGLRRQTARIVGTISDASGARVPEAIVTAAEVNTGNTRTAVSNANGFYTIPLLPPGTYNVKVSKDGFRT